MSEQVIQRYYRKADIAKILSVSTRTVERMDTERKIPGRAELPSGGVRWFKPAVDAWVDGLAKKSA